MSGASLGEFAAARHGGQGPSQRGQGSSAAEKAELSAMQTANYSRLHGELQRLSAAKAQLQAQLERGKGELAVVNQQLAGAKFVHNVYSSKVKRMVSERRQISGEISAMEQERAGLHSSLNEQRPGRPDDARRSLSSAAEDSVTQHLRQLEEAEARHQQAMHASKNAHLSSLREIQADFVKGVAPSANARPGSTPSGSSADTPGGATANALDATAPTDEEAGEGELGGTAVAVVAGSETGQAKRAAAVLDQEVQRLQARLVAREEALSTGEEEVLQLRAERMATRAELAQAEASMLSVMEELARKAQALSAVQQQVENMPSR
jgi:hypothetical protein